MKVADAFKDIPCKVRRSLLVFVIIGVSFGGVIFASFPASASGPIDDIPEEFAEALNLDDSYVAEMILSMFVLASLGLALAAARAPPSIIIILLIVAIGTLTVMGWLDTWVLVLVGLLTVALFGRALIFGGPFFGGDKDA